MKEKSWILQLTDLTKGTYHLSELVGQTDESLSRMRQFNQAVPASCDQSRHSSSAGSVWPQLTTSIC